MARKPDTNFLSGTAKTGPYKTPLSMHEELQFQDWLKKNRIPYKDEKNADYDMRGFWKAMAGGDPLATRSLANDGSMHFPDVYKTPYHETFSNESRYATSNAPGWRGDTLVDKLGTVLKDESKR